MSILEITTPPDPILRQRAKKVYRLDAQLQQLIDDMIETMRRANGVGLAAPQVGRSLRLAVVESLPEQDEEGNDIPNSRQLYVLINPEITWRSRRLVEAIEGCLSIPGYVGEVARPDAIRVKALDRKGKKISLRLRDWTARIFQHEVDHLDGVLFIDRLTAPEKLWTEEEYYRQDAGSDEAASQPVQRAGTMAD